MKRLKEMSAGELRSYNSKIQKKYLKKLKTRKLCWNCHKKQVKIVKCPHCFEVLRHYSRCEDCISSLSKKEKEKRFKKQSENLIKNAKLYNLNKRKIKEGGEE